MIPSTELEILIQVVVAGLLGAVIGFDRELAGKPAGLRTQMLVAATSALLTALGVWMVAESERKDWDLVRSDPIRMVQAIVTGLGFIGAGTIMFHRGEERVEGVTTAATLLLSAAIGIAVGLHLYLVGIGVTTLGIIALAGVGMIERRMPDGRGAQKRTRKWQGPRRDDSNEDRT